MSPDSGREHLRVAAVVLAAGASRRLGSPKQLVRLRGKSLVRNAVDAACGSRCHAVTVVVGAASDRVVQELEGADVTIVLNSDWERGLSTSIAAGVRSARGADAWMLLLVDQPHLTAAVLDRLLDAYDGTPTGIAACRYAGTPGVPAIFGRDHAQALTNLEGDQGAKNLLAAANLIDWEEGAVDIDTPQHLAGLAKERR